MEWNYGNPQLFDYLRWQVRDAIGNNLDRHQGLLYRDNVIIVRLTAVDDFNL